MVIFHRSLRMVVISQQDLVSRLDDSQANLGKGWGSDCVATSIPFAVNRVLGRVPGGV